MLYKIIKNRKLVEDENFAGYNKENRAEMLEFEIPESLSEYTATINFETDDGNVYDLLDNGIYTLKNNITKYDKVRFYLEFTKEISENNLEVIKTEVKTIEFGDSFDVDNEITQEEINIIRTIITQAGEAITRANAISENLENKRDTDYYRGAQGEQGKTGAPGFSPVVTTETVNDGVNVSITDINGTHTFKIKNGENGQVDEEIIREQINEYLNTHDIQTVTKTSELINDSEFVSDSNYVHTDNNYTNVEQQKLSNLSNYDDTQIKQDITNLNNNKVSKVEGKELSTNDFTNTDKNNLDQNTTARHAHNNKNVLDNISSNNITRWNNKAEISDIPDVSNFITNAVNNLLNYYLKGEVYTKIEVNNLIGQISTLQFIVVQELPATGDGQYLYLVPSTNPQTRNIKDEYIWFNDNWEQIGNTEIDLRGYATESWVNSQISYFLTESDVSTLITTALNGYAKSNEIPTKVSDLTNDSGFITDYTETDPTVPSHVKNITQANIETWNNKSNFSGNYNDLTNKPSIPSAVTESTVSGWGFTKNAGTYSKPSDGIPKSDLASAVQASLGKADTALQEHQDISGKQDITENNLTTMNKTIPSAINEVNSIAKGANQALSFGDYSTMITVFNSLANNIYKVGQNVMIVTLQVPDLWISGIESTSQAYTHTTDEAFTTALNTNGYVKVGYYKLSALETQKVNLTDYVTNTDYADSSVAGVIKTGSSVGTNVSNAGVLYASNLNYESYQNLGNNGFIGKGTLENVLRGKGLNPIVELTQAEYDALTTKDSNTYYYIVEE